MALKTPNTTWDQYRYNASPPAAPLKAGVKVYLYPDWANAHHAAVVSGTSIGRWTHVALVATDNDLRDHYNPSGFSDSFGTHFDTVYIPDQNGQPFDVVMVTRVGKGTPGDCFKVYLQRRAVTWPSSNL
jgi:hypothetical protein